MFLFLDQTCLQGGLRPVAIMNGGKYPINLRYIPRLSAPRITPPRPDAGPPGVLMAA